jgi:hypothetical protein
MASPAAAIDQVGETRRPALIEIFRERCEARCLLVHNGHMTLQNAVDGLQESAAAQRLVATHGQDEIQWILSEAFGRWRLANE